MEVVMAASVANIEMKERRSEFRLLFYALLLAAAYVGLNIALSQSEAAAMLFAAVRVVIHGVLLAGLWLALARTAWSSTARIATWLAIAAPWTAWLAGVWTLALDGAFLPGATRIPMLPLAVLGPLLLALPVLLRSKRIGVLLDAMPPSWLVGVQLYRVLGGVFLVAWMAGGTPAVFAFPAAIGDLLTGLLALPVAASLQRDPAQGRTLARAWNGLGLLDLVTAITLGAMTAPGPLQLLAFDHPNLLVGAYPNVLIPAFIVPSSIILHALSLRQLRRSARAAGGRS
jgi:hypothetical protein